MCRSGGAGWRRMIRYAGWRDMIRCAGGEEHESMHDGGTW
jgi:hypothetical protein